MAGPIEVKTGIETVEVAPGSQVFGRVLRIELRLQLGGFGGGWVLGLPYLVVDRRSSPPRRLPVIDPTLVGAVVMVFLATLLSRRKESSDGRGEQVSAGV